MSMIFKGKYIVFSLFLLTAIIGASFIYLGPKALQTNPGVLHLGIRYADEFSIDFTRFPKGGPGAVLEIYDENQVLIDRYENLSMGRNLIPIDPEKFKHRLYSFHISAPSYKSVQIEVQNQNRILSAINNHTEKENVLIEPNLLGVRLEPIETN